MESYVTNLDFPKLKGSLLTPPKIATANQSAVEKLTADVGKKS